VLTYTFAKGKCVYYLLKVLTYTFAEGKCVYFYPGLGYLYFNIIIK